MHKNPYYWILLTVNPQKFPTISEQLSSNAPIFANTPYSNTSCSVLLRSAKAQHVILEKICLNIWQPIHSGALLDPNTQRLMNDIYSTLAHRGPRPQSTWRLLSVESMDTLTNGQNPNTTSLVDDVLEKLEPLIPQEWKVMLKEELEGIFQDAAELWSIVQKDRNLIEIDCVPNPEDEQGWVEDNILQTYVPELVEPVPKPFDSSHVFTFPKVLRYGYHGDPTSPALVIHKGSAIFSNSVILREAAREWEGQDQDMRDASYKATTKTRSPVITLHQEPTLLRDRIRNGKRAIHEPLPNGT
jgi:hypothetical protein